MGSLYEHTAPLKFILKLLLTSLGAKISSFILECSINACDNLSQLVPTKAFLNRTQLFPKEVAAAQLFTWEACDLFQSINEL